MQLYAKNYNYMQKIICSHFLALLQSVEILSNGAVAASVPYSITFASRSKKNYDDTRVDCK